MNRTITAAISGLIVLVLILYSTTYTVNFHELAVTTRLGREAGIVREPGIHLKLPFFIDSVATLDTRSQLVRSPSVHHYCEGMLSTLIEFLRCRSPPVDRCLLPSMLFQSA